MFSMLTFEEKVSINHIKTIWEPSKGMEYNTCAYKWWQSMMGNSKQRTDVAYKYVAPFPLLLDTIKFFKSLLKTGFAVYQNFFSVKNFKTNLLIATGSSQWYFEISSPFVEKWTRCSTIVLLELPKSFQVIKEQHNFKN